MRNLIVNTCTGCIRSVLVLAILWLLFGGLSQGQTAVPKSDTVHITSDRLEANQQEQQVVFIGNVVAKQGDLTIRGDRLTIFYLEAENPKPNERGLAGKIDRIVVDGSVRISQKNVLATGENAVYFGEDNKVVLTGKPRVEQGKDFIQGDKITLFLDTEKSIVEGGPSGPVEATIYSSATGGSIDRGSVEGEGNSGTDRDE